MGEVEMESESSASAGATDVRKTAWKKYAAEFIGTFVLVFMGCGSAVFLGVSQTTIPSIAFAFGLSLLVMANGRHYRPINPAAISMFIRQ
jgi:glycerol uptake facilitator-like aquaporin